MPEVLIFLGIFRWCWGRNENAQFRSLGCFASPNFAPRCRTPVLCLVVHLYTCTFCHRWLAFPIRPNPQRGTMLRAAFRGSYNFHVYRRINPVLTWICHQVAPRSRVRGPSFALLPASRQQQIWWALMSFPMHQKCSRDCMHRPGPL